MAVPPYRFATVFTGPAYFVPCGIALLNEIAEAVRLGLLDVTNLGQYADSNHSPTSRHAPHPDGSGKLWIAAADFGGRDYTVLAEFFRYLYKRRDPRIYAWGYCQRGDGRGIRWTDGEWTWTGKDQGHCHIDFAMADRSIGGRTDRTWWTAALNDTSPWGLIEWLRTGGISNDSITEDFDVPFSQWPQSEKDALASYIWGGIKISVPGGMEAPAVTLGLAVNRAIAGVIADASKNRNMLAEFTRTEIAKADVAVSDEQLARLAAAVVAAVDSEANAISNDDVARITAAVVAVLADQPITIGGSK